MILFKNFIYSSYYKCFCYRAIDSYYDYNNIDKCFITIIKKLITYAQKLYIINTEFATEYQ